MYRELLFLPKEKYDMLLKSSSKEEEKSLTRPTTDVPHEKTKKIQQIFEFIVKKKTNGPHLDFSCKSIYRRNILPGNG